MLSKPDTLILGVYYAALIFLVAYGAHRAWLTLWFFGKGQEPPQDLKHLPESEWPRVTIQLPMYNERYVAERIIRSAAAIRYPTELVQLQVLDDSTDDTRKVVDRIVAELAATGLNIEAVRRPTRVGYKAGALDYGLDSATGELIAVFDADFVPEPDFLEQLVAHFQDERIGMVQARWEHLNRDGLLLTRAQAMLLDGHFVVEQTARARGGRFFNFNGTAGIWRRATIDDAGGWQHDTITEDLDLSYRAQLKGWRCIYRTDVAAPAELPADLSAFKSQQHRWAKGSIECLRKLFIPLITAKVPWWKKLEGLIQLTANLTYPAMLVLAVMMPLTMRVRAEQPADWGLWLDLPLFAVGTGAVVLFYMTSQLALGRSAWRAAAELPFALAIDIGMSVHKTRGVLEALVGHRTAFVRTPKMALVERSPRRIADGYLRKTWRGGLAEMMLCGWLLYGVVIVYRSPWPSLLPLPFLLLFAMGFAYTAGIGLWQALPLPARSAAPATVEV